MNAVALAAIALANAETLELFFAAGNADRWVPKVCAELPVLPELPNKCHKGKVKKQRQSIKL